MKPHFFALFCLFSFGLAAGSGVAHATRSSSDTAASYVVRYTGEPRPLLYDFVEAGIEETALVTPTDDLIGAAALLRDVLPEEPAELVSQVAAKLNEISLKNPSYAEALLAQLRSYRWNVIRPELIPVGDIGSTPVRRTQDMDVIMASLRDDYLRIVYLNRTVWRDLDLINQTGLILHEANYILVKEQLKSNAERYETASASASAFARSLTAVNFDPRFDRMLAGDLSKRLKTVGVRNINYYGRECVALRAQAKAWLPRVQAEFTRYMTQLEERRRVLEQQVLATENSWFLEVRLLDSVDHNGDLVLGTGSDYNRLDVEGQIFYLPHSKHFPRQIIIHSDQDRPVEGNKNKETQKPATYAVLEALSREGLGIDATNNTLGMSCLAMGTNDKEFFYFKTYAGLKPAPWLESTRHNYWRK